MLFLPKLIVAGFSAYSRTVDFKAIRKVTKDQSLCYH